jgi:hypothetical protein
MPAFSKRHGDPTLAAEIPVGLGLISTDPSEIARKNKRAGDIEPKNAVTSVWFPKG